MARTSSKTAADSAAGGAPAKTPKVKKRRWYHQVWEVFSSVREQQPSITWMILGIVLGAAALGFGVAWLVSFPVALGAILGFTIGLMLAMILLGRRAEHYAYKRIEGQAGAVGAALGTIRRGWNIEEEPVAVDPRTQDMIYRAVGRPGVVLVSEGPPHRVAKMLEAEKRKVARVVPNVPVILLQEGRGEGQIPLPQLAKAVQKQKKAISAGVVPEIAKRLRALQRMNRLPVPKGIDPMKARPDRKAARGR
jgi:hypothetical protein